MSYEPLHHKYRPQTFADLVGQEAIAQTLINAILTQRIAPAYLFTGPRGTGKTSSARILAKSLNCLKQDQPTESPCGVCEVCRTIASGTALDVIEIDAASNTGVDNIREIIERAQFAPVQCRYKVYVVDECHMLSTAAFNALLKTLEEPPKHVVFVLATTDPQRVLPTIISRCQKFDFRRIPLEAMVQHLQHIASEENIDITSDALTLVAQVAQGGLRDAESLLDQLSLLPTQVTVEQVWDLVGAVPERDLMELTQAIASDNLQAVLDRCRRLLDRGREPLVVLQNLASFYRDLLIAKTAPNRNDLVAVTPPTWKQLCEFAQSVDVSDILRGQQHLKNSEVQIKNSTQPRLWLEVTLLGLLPSANTLTLRVQENPKSQTVSAKSTQQSTPTIKASTNDALKTPSQDSLHQAANNSPSLRSQPVESTPVVAPSAASVSDSAVTPEEVATPSPVVQSALTSQQSEDEPLWQQVINNIELSGTKQLLRDHCCLVSFKDGRAIIGVNGKGKLGLIERTAPQLNKAFTKTVKNPVKLTFQQVEVTASKSAPTFDVNEAEYKRSEVGLSERPAKESTSPNTTADLPPYTEALVSTQYPTINKSSQIAAKAEGSVRLEVSSSSPTTAVTSSVISPPLQEVDLDASQVEKALAMLKQSFDGEIIQLTDDSRMNQLDISTHLQSEDDKDETTAHIQVEPEEDIETQNRNKKLRPQGDRVLGNGEWGMGNGERSTNYPLPITTTADGDSSSPTRDEVSSPINNEIAATHQWQASEIAALEDSKIRQRLETLGYVENDDSPDEIPF